MAKILAPNKSYTGVTASVPFANGEGKTYDAHLIAWFESKGYEVIHEETNNFSYADLTVDKLKDLITERGLGVPENRSINHLKKAELVDILENGKVAEPLEAESEEEDEGTEVI